MKKILIVLLCIALFGNSRNTWGVNAIQVTDIGSSAQTIGKANIEGFNHTAASALENPASLDNIKKHSASFFTTTLMEDVLFRSYAVATKTKYGVFGLGLTSASIDDLPFTKVNGLDQFEVDHYFNYQNAIYKLAYCYPISNKIAIGTSLSYLSNGSEGIITGKGYNVDFGLVTHGKTFDTSITVKNAIAISGVRYSNTAKEDFPVEATVGLRYHPKTWYSLYAQLRHYDIRGNLFPSAALEFHPARLSFFTLSGGFKSFQTTTKQVKSSITLGVGLKLAGVNYAYAYETSEHYQYNSKHYFSLGVNF